MGSYLLSECRNRPYTAEDAALPRISGEHVVQILPQALVERAGLFPAMDVARQVSVSRKTALPLLSPLMMRCLAVVTIGVSGQLDMGILCSWSCTMSAGCPYPVATLLPCTHCVLAVPILQLRCSLLQGRC